MYRNEAGQKITLLVIDTATNRPKGGEAANLTAYQSKNDGTVTVLADTSATEKDGTNAPGLYDFDLAQAETNAAKIVFSGKSTTSGVYVVPVTVSTQERLDRRPWTANGYVTLTLDATVTTGDETVNEVHVLPDGSVLAAGGSYIDSHFDRHLVLRYTPNGQLDSTFGATAAGYTLTNYDAHGGPTSIQMQADGKILVAGVIYNESVTGGFWGKGQLSIARYQPNGAYDPTYGTAGHTVTSITQDDQIWGLALQADGKSVFGGFTMPTANHYNFLAGRYQTDGTLDPLWNSVGYTSVDFGGTDDRCYSVAMQSRGANAGKVVAAGLTGALLVSYNAALCRFDTNGTLDTTFGTAGKVTTDLGGTTDWWLAVAIQPADDKIVVLGLSNTGPGGNYVFAVARYSANGVLDSSFGTAGVARFTIGDGSQGSLRASLLVQPDGKILFGTCYADVATSTLLGVTLARIDSVGVLDPTFGTAGVVKTEFGALYAECNSIALQPDGKIVVGGRLGLDINGTGRIALVARFLPDGTLDSGSAASSLVTAADQILGRLGTPDLADHARQLNIIGAAAIGTISGAGTATEIFVSLDGVTVRATVTADAPGNRTAVVYNEGYR